MDAQDGMTGLGPIPPELLALHWAADGVGQLPSYEWARAGCFARMISMGPALAGTPDRCVAAHGMVTVSRRTREINPVLWILDRPRTARNEPERRPAGKSL
jgi:hypothetical protein